MVFLTPPAPQKTQVAPKRRLGTAQTPFRCHPVQLTAFYFFPAHCAMRCRASSVRSRLPKAVKRT